MVIYAPLMWAQDWAGPTDLLVYSACPDSSTPALKGWTATHHSQSWEHLGGGPREGFEFLEQKIQLHEWKEYKVVSRWGEARGGCNVLVPLVCLSPSHLYVRGERGH